MLYADTFGTPWTITGLTLMNNVWAESNHIIMWLNGNVRNISINYNNYYSSYLRRLGSKVRIIPGGNGETWDMTRTVKDLNRTLCILMRQI